MASTPSDPPPDEPDEPDQEQPPRDADLEKYLAPAASPETPPKGVPRIRRRDSSILRWSVAFTSGVCFAVVLQWGLERSFQTDRGALDGRVVNEVAGLIADRYVDEKRHQSLMIDALNGMTEDLDPYSKYVSPEELPQFVEDTEGEYVGVGILLGDRPRVESEIDERETHLGARIHGVLPGGPADEAGLKPGDWIVRIGPLSMSAPADLESLRKQLQGPPGSEVILTIRRRQEETEKSVRVVRNQVSIPSIATVGAIERHGPVGYIRLTQFQSNTPAEFVEAMRLLDKKKITGLILDLRGNPGGVLPATIDVVTELLPKGTLVVTTRGRHEEKSYSTERAGRWTEVPLAVLIDRNTASAAEIVAAAVQDHQRGLLIGETTYGKGRVQTIYTLRRDPERFGLVKLTTQRFVSPSGRSIDRHTPAGDRGDGGGVGEARPEGGVSPDIRVAQADYQPFLTELRQHFHDLPHELWSRGTRWTEAPEYRCFTWVDPDTSTTYRDQQLEEALSSLADLESFSRKLGQTRQSAHARQNAASSDDSHSRY